MPSPWSPLDNVQVRVAIRPGAAGPLWVDAVVDLVVSPGVYCCSITGNPRPSLADCGKTNRYAPGTARLAPIITVSEASNALSGTPDSIRDPI
jgi:hypothetical protein